MGNQKNGAKMKINSDLALVVGVLALAIIGIFLIYRKLEILLRVVTQGRAKSMKNWAIVAKQSLYWIVILAALSALEFYLIMPSPLSFLKCFAFGTLLACIIILSYLTQKAIWGIFLLLLFGSGLFIPKIFPDDLNMFAAVVFSGLGSFLVLFIFRKKILSYSER